MNVSIQSLVRFGSLAALLSWASTIIYLSSLGQQEIDPLTLPFPYWDKFLHFIAFSVGGGLQAAAIKVWTRWSFRRALAVSILVIACFGAADEWHQRYTPTRTGADVWDWFADVLGAICGAFFTLKLWPNHLLRKLSNSER